MVEYGSAITAGGCSDPQCPCVHVHVYREDGSIAFNCKMSTDGASMFAKMLGDAIDERVQRNLGHLS